MDTVKTDKRLQNMKPYYEEFPIQNSLRVFVNKKLNDDEKNALKRKEKLVKYAYQQLFSNDLSRNNWFAYIYLLLKLIKFVALSNPDLIERDKRIIKEVTEKEKYSGNYVGYNLLSIPALFYDESLEEGISSIIEDDHDDNTQSFRATRAERAIVDAYNHVSELDDSPKQRMKIKDLVDLSFMMAKADTQENECTLVIELLLTSEIDITWIIKRFNYCITHDVLKLIRIYTSNPQDEKEIIGVINSGGLNRVLKKLSRKYSSLDNPKE